MEGTTIPPTTVDGVDEKSRRIKFLETTLLQEILKNNGDLNEMDVVKCTVTSTETLDGFMSAIFMMELQMKCKTTQKISIYPAFIKLMKGDERFRESTRSNVQFANEVYIYANVLPAFRQFLSNTSSKLNIDDLVPRLYYGFHGQIPELSDMDECILAVANISPLGYRNGPRCELDASHLFQMTELIAKYHAVSFAMKISKSVDYQQLVNGIIPLPFIGSEIYNVLYTVGFQRFFQHLTTVTDIDPNVRQATDNLRNRYGNNPVGLLERIRQYDGPFAIILHGDYNRNNVLFRYASSDGYDNPLDPKMIDFQEVRYGTPAIDLSFFLYMNADPAERNLLWDKLLKYYHETVINCLTDILNCSADDNMLKPYSYENFLDHFASYAFYGTMVCIHFIPWMLCSQNECNKLSNLFETNMHGDEFTEFSMVCGGRAPDERILGIVQHACEHGYMEFLNE